MNSSFAHRASDKGVEWNRNLLNDLMANGWRFDKWNAASIVNMRGVCVCVYVFPSRFDSIDEFTILGWFTCTPAFLLFEREGERNECTFHIHCELSVCESVALNLKQNPIGKSQWTMRDDHNSRDLFAISIHRIDLFQIKLAQFYSLPSLSSSHLLLMMLTIILNNICMFVAHKCTLTY